MEEMKQLKCMEKGKLIVGASTVPGEYILPSYMSSFKDAYPTTEVEILTGSSEHIVEDLLNEDIHIGVVGMKVNDSRINSITFKKDEVILVVRKNHPLTSLSKVTPKDIIKYPLVIREKGSGSRKLLEDQLEKNGFRLKNFPYYNELSGSRSGITAIKNSDALAFASSLVAADSIKLGDVVKVKVDNLDMKRDIYLIHNNLKTLSPLSETFFNFMKNKKD